MACRLGGAKPLSEPVLEYCKLEMASVLFQPQCVNSLAPGQCVINFRIIIFKLLIRNNTEKLLSGKWHIFDVKSTLVHVLAWYHQVPSHYLSQCWPRSRHHVASLGHNEFRWGIQEPRPKSTWTRSALRRYTVHHAAHINKVLHYEQMATIMTWCS